MLPALVATFALMFVAATPYALAEFGDGYTAYNDGDGAKNMHKKSHHSVQVEGFVGSISITDDSDKASLREQVTVSLSEAADGLDVKRASLGVAINENGDKYLVWKLVNVDRDSESETATITIYVVDAADAENTTTVTKEFDSSIKDKRQGDRPNGTQFKELRENRIPAGNPA